MKERIIFDSRAAIDEEYDAAMWYEDEQTNLDKYLAGNIVALADLGLWYGRVKAYKVLNNNLSSILNTFHCDDITVYQDRYNVRSKCFHHDGTNYILFRMLRPELSYEEMDHFQDLICRGKLSNRDLRRYTVSLNKEIDSIYGKM